MSRQRRLLLVTPTFHGYGSSIASALNESGYDVVVCRYDARDSFRHKLHHKARHELPSLAGIATDASERGYVTQQAVDAIGQIDPDVIVTIKGDTFDDDYWDAVDTSQARHVLWLYDELRRMRHTDSTLDRAGSIATYSPLDAQALGAQGRRVAVVHNAFDPHHAITATPANEEVTFIGARYPRREDFLIQLHQAGVPVRAYGRQWSRHPFDLARTWQFSRPSLPAERDVPRAEAYGIMAASLATLNIHADQDGFTMRTFEAPGTGSVQLIDRADVSELYEPDREIACFSSTEELVELCHRVQRDPLWANGIRESGRARTLAEHTWAHRVPVLESLWD